MISGSIIERFASIRRYVDIPCVYIDAINWRIFNKPFALNYAKLRKPWIDHIKNQLGINKTADGEWTSKQLNTLLVVPWKAQGSLQVELASPAAPVFAVAKHAVAEQLAEVWPVVRNKTLKF